MMEQHFECLYVEIGWSERETNFIVSVYKQFKIYISKCFNAIGHLFNFIVVKKNIHMLIS